MARMLDEMRAIEASDVTEATDATLRVRRWARHHTEVWGAATLVFAWLAVTLGVATSGEPDTGSAAGLLRVGAIAAAAVAAMFAWWTATTALIGHVVREDALDEARCVDGASVLNGRTTIMALRFADDECVWLSAWHRRTYRRGRVLVAGRGRVRVAVWPGATRPVLLHRTFTSWGDAARRRAIARTPQRDRIP